MQRQEISIAQAKTHFSELINKVIYGREEVVITKRGKPVALISTPVERGSGLGSVKGWISSDDAFFKEMKQIVEGRHSKRLRSAGKHEDRHVSL